MRQDLNTFSDIMHGNINIDPKKYFLPRKAPEDTS